MVLNCLGFVIAMARPLNIEVDVDILDILNCNDFNILSADQRKECQSKVQQR